MNFKKIGSSLGNIVTGAKDSAVAVKEIISVKNNLANAFIEANKNNIDINNNDFLTNTIKPLVEELVKLDSAIDEINDKIKNSGSQVIETIKEKEPKTDK